MQAFYYFHRALMPYSNWNHTCPYNVNFDMAIIAIISCYVLNNPLQGSLLVKDFVLEDEYFAKVPLPMGNYMINLKIAANSVWTANFKLYMDVDVKQSIRN